MRCNRCNGLIDDFDYYAKVGDRHLCLGCLGIYIDQNFDILDIADALGISVFEYQPEDKPTKATIIEDVEGQVSIFDIDDKKIGVKHEC